MERKSSSNQQKPNQITSVVNSAMRAFDVLECIAATGRPLSVREVANLCGISRPTAYRYLVSLAKRGYVTSYRNDTYDLGSRLLTLGRNFLERYDWVSLVEPKLYDLSRESGETVHIGLFDQGEMLYVAKVDSPQSVRMHSSLGTRSPIYCTAMGKSVLANLDETSRNEELSKIELVARTENTKTNKAELLEELKQVAALGYAIDDVENEAGVRCVSAPIFDFKGGVIGAISISGPAYRLEIPNLKELAPSVMNAAHEISKVIGFVPKPTPKNT